MTVPALINIFSPMFVLPIPRRSIRLSSNAKNLFPAQSCTTSFSRPRSSSIAARPLLPPRTFLGRHITHALALLFLSAIIPQTDDLPALGQLAARHGPELFDLLPATAAQILNVQDLDDYGDAPARSSRSGDVKSAARRRALAVAVREGSGGSGCGRVDRSLESQFCDGGGRHWEMSDARICEAASSIARGGLL
ncbi:hypothetical protein PoMZ_07880 [Pyricularia oryzae]|uniref:Uncharacterized protein n=1 Tax=Pyricularia oryzae TaxID=318829 RepID=A0A4P7NGG7_PYROR|nr:hypothetical protein PoMZ_07880 [Pyricularia oryzae]